MVCSLVELHQHEANDPDDEAGNGKLCIGHIGHGFIPYQ